MTSHRLVCFIRNRLMLMTFFFQQHARTWTNTRLDSLHYNTYALLWRYCGRELKLIKLVERTLIKLIERKLILLIGRKLIKLFEHELIKLFERKLIKWCWIYKLVLCAMYIIAGGEIVHAFSIRCYSLSDDCEASALSDRRALCSATSRGQLVLARIIGSLYSGWV